MCKFWALTLTHSSGVLEKQNQSRRSGIVHLKHVASMPSRPATRGATQATVTFPCAESDI